MDMSCNGFYIEEGNKYSCIHFTFSFLSRHSLWL